MLIFLHVDCLIVDDDEASNVLLEEYLNRILKQIAQASMEDKAKYQNVTEHYEKTNGGISVICVNPMLQTRYAGQSIAHIREKLLHDDVELHIFSAKLIKIYYHLT